MTQESRRDYVQRAPRFKVDQSSNLEVTISRTEQSSQPPLKAELLDVSLHGAKLKVPANLRFEEALQLTINVLDSEFSYLGVASVRHIRSFDEDHWVVGCAIAPPLSDEAFSYLATTAGKERRRYRRFEISADAIVRRQAHPGGTPARLHNLSSGGICFSSTDRYEVGEMVQIVVEDKNRASCIVDARVCWNIDRDDGSIAGCQFTTHTSYTELCRCLTDQPSLRSLHASAEPTSKLVLTTAVLAMFVPPVMTLMLQANKVSAKADEVQQLAGTIPLDVAESSNPAGTPAKHEEQDLTAGFGPTLPVAGRPVLTANLVEDNQFRTWVDNTGKHRTLAKLLEVTPEYVLLEKANSRQSKVPLRRLSEADLEYIKHWKAR